MGFEKAQIAWARILILFEKHTGAKCKIELEVVWIFSLAYYISAPLSVWMCTATHTGKWRLRGEEQMKILVLCLNLRKHQAYDFWSDMLLANLRSKHHWSHSCYAVWKTTEPNLCKAVAWLKPVNCVVNETSSPVFNSHWTSVESYWQWYSACLRNSRSDLILHEVRGLIYQKE